MVIETKRLKIIALTQEQLEILVDHIPEFEKKLNCSYQGEKIEGIFKSIGVQGVQTRLKRNVRFESK